MWNAQEKVFYKSCISRFLLALGGRVYSLFFNSSGWLKSNMNLILAGENLMQFFCCHWLHVILHIIKRNIIYKNLQL